MTADPPVLVPGDIVTASPCPICHTEPTGFSSEAETVILQDVEPAWEPDGPLVSVPYTERAHVIGWTYTLHPCGHHVPREAVRITITRPSPAQRRGVNAQRWGAH